MSWYETKQQSDKKGILETDTQILRVKIERRWLSVQMEKQGYWMATLLLSELQ